MDKGHRDSRLGKVFVDSQEGISLLGSILDMG